MIEFSYKLLLSNNNRPPIIPIAEVVTTKVSNSSSRMIKTASIIYPTIISFNVDNLNYNDALLSLTYRLITK